MKKNNEVSVNWIEVKRGGSTFVRRWVLLLLLQFSCGYAFSQTSSFDIKVKDYSLSRVIEYITHKTDHSFVFKVADVAGVKGLTMDFKGATIRQVMDYCLQGTNLSYEIDGELVVIKPGVLQRQSEKDKFITIEGIVKDVKGDKLAGVTVMVADSQTGAITDVDGQFRLECYRDDPKVKLRFTYIGMKPQEIRTDGASYMTVVMQEDIQAMEDVVITGYQVIDKKKLTSAISSIKAADLMIPGQNSIDKMLEGRIPDLTVINNSGEVGTVPRIRIRGTSTLIGNREPLWVVDGIVVNDPVQISAEELNDPDYINRVGNAISGINPQDIDRIDVLKDASSTALYGVRAANGVIVVTTKKGRVGKPQVNYNMNLTFKLRPSYSDRSVNVMNSQERINFSKDLVANHHGYESTASLIGYEGLLSQLYSGAITNEQFNAGVARMESMNTDWFSDIAQNSLSHQHTVSVSGGSENIRYYASLGYVKDNDVIRGNQNQRNTGSLNLDINFNDRLSASFNMNGNVSKRNYNQASISPIDYAYNTSRAIANYDSEGAYSFYKRSKDNKLYSYNIMNELANSGTEQNSNGLSLTGNVDYKIFPWLSAKAILSYSVSNSDIEGYWGDQTYYISTQRRSDIGVAPDKGSDSQSECPFGGELTKNNSRTNSYTARLQLDGSKYFGTEEQHNITLNLGYEVSSTDYDQYSSVERGYFPDRGKSFISDVNLSDYPKYMQWMTSEYNLPLITENLSNLLSAYASLSYSYKRWITLNANARIDGSNKFGSRSNEKLLPIWSVSAAYNIWEHLGDPESKIIDNIALRTSYGYQGNMLDDQSPRMIITKLPMNSHFNELESNVSVYPNPDLRWEKTSSFNVGLDLSFLEGAIQLGSSYYYKVTSDAFMTKNISTVNGTGTYVVNNGTVKNYGYSFDVTLNPIQNKDWRWTISTSISKVFNKMTTQPDNDSYELSNYLNGTALVQGQPVGTFYSYKFIGLNPTDGGPMFDDMQECAEELIGKSNYEGYTAVLTPSGNREPTIQGSLNTSLRYKSFRLGVNLAYSLGNKVRLFRLYPNGINFNPEQNINSALNNRWQKPGDERTTNIPNIINGSSAESVKYLYHWSYRYYNGMMPVIAENAWDMYDYGNQRVVSGNYLKCSNLSFSYDIPEEKLRRWFIKGLSVTLSASNIFTISSSKLNGQTPMQSGFSDIQLSERPTFTTGISITL